MKKRNSRLLACALAVVLCMTAFSIPTFAAGYYASNENGNNTPPDAIESITVLNYTDVLSSLRGRHLSES